MSLFHVTILTIFPEMFPGPLQYSLAGKALKNNIWSLDVVNIRDFGLTKHKKIDDEAYGGSSGLIMRPDVLGSAIDYVLSKRPNSKIYYPSPRGTRLTQGIVHEIIQDQEIIILCGRFEGIDERIIDEYNVKEISVGDYILSGGEIASLAIIDCSIRLLEGVLVNQETLSAESFERNGEFLGLLECSLYTRPEEWKARKVPPTLLSGNHKMIAKWRKEESLLVTKARRPDLLE